MYDLCEFRRCFALTPRFKQNTMNCKEMNHSILYKNDGKQLG